tara:strand:+ start:90 stop:728 length:639 start_codon:yes stop_codon:yes gene_type:complete
MLVNNLTVLEMQTEMYGRAEIAANEAGKKFTAGIRTMADAVGVDYATMKGFALGTTAKPSEATVDRVRIYLRDNVVGENALQEELDRVMKINEELNAEIVRRKDEQQKNERWWADRLRDVNDELEMIKQRRFSRCHDVSELVDFLSADELAELVFRTTHMFRFGLVDEDQEPEGKVLNPLEINTDEDGHPTICTEKGYAVVILRDASCSMCE